MRTPLLLGVASTLLLPGCVTHVFRLDEPARIERVGLDAVEADLVLVDVVHGIFPKHQEELALAIPRGWETAPTRPGDDGELVLDPPLQLQFRPELEHTLPERELLFRGRDTSRWQAATRAEHRLRLAQDLPAADRRTYEVVNLRREDGSVDLLLRGRRGNDPVRVLGHVRLPDDVTGRSFSTWEKIAVAPPLAIVGLAWVPVTAASTVVTLPFGSSQLLFGDEPDDIPGWLLPPVPLEPPGRWIPPGGAAP